MFTIWFDRGTTWHHESQELMKSIGFGYPGGPERAANPELPVTSYSGPTRGEHQNRAETEF